MDEKQKLYKVVSADLKSQNGGTFDWRPYLPNGEGSPGKWTPAIDVSVCESGYHVTPHPCMWIENGSRVFEVETCGDGVKSDEVGTIDKIAFPQIRFVRELTNYQTSGDRNSGYRNSGDRNSGDRNSGDRNSGDRNYGYRNSGNVNSGYRNSGYRNSGNVNSGDRNSGNRNSGNRNSGYRNSGDRNSGNWNSGNWNSCDRESGFLNTEHADTIRVFNRPCSRKDWEAAVKPDFFYFELIPEDYQASWQKSYEAASEEDRRKVFDLPNFDAAVFYDLTGIDLRGAV